MVYDVDAASAKALAGQGAVEATSPMNVAEQCDSIITMLPNNEIVRSVYTDSNGILSAVKANALMIDSSTIDPAVSKEMAAECANRQAFFVDAPVSGGSPDCQCPSAS